MSNTSTIQGQTAAGKPVSMAASTGTAGSTTAQPTLAQELVIITQAVAAAEQAIELIMEMMPHSQATTAAPAPKTATPQATASAVPPVATPPKPPAPPTPAQVAAARQPTVGDVKSEIQFDAHAAIASSQTRLAQIDQQVKNGQLDPDQAQAERLKLEDTIQGVQTLAKLGASLPGDRNPQAVDRFNRLHELLTMTANNQIDKEQAMAEAYDIKQSLLVPDSDAPGPLADARKVAKAALAEGEAAMNAQLQRMRELQTMVMNNVIDADQAQGEMVKLSETYRSVEAMTHTIANQPIDRAPDAAAQLQRLREISSQLASGSANNSQVAPDVYLSTQKLSHPGLFTNGQPSASVSQGAQALYAAAESKRTTTQWRMDLDAKVASGQITGQRADVERSMIASNMRQADGVFAKYHVSTALAGLTALDAQAASDAFARATATAR